nr:MAG TPA: hypothetical protein [Caudoviricetes sp.]
MLLKLLLLRQSTHFMGALLRFGLVHRFFRLWFDSTQNGFHALLIGRNTTKINI